MGAKWLLILVLGTLGLLRSLQPAFFRYWIRTEFEPLFELRSGFSINSLLVGVIGVLSFVILQELDWGFGALEGALLLPLVIGYRILISFFLAYLLSGRGSSPSLLVGPSVASASYVYLILAGVMLGMRLLPEALLPFKNWVVVLAHVLGLLWFARLIPALQNIRSIGVRYYAFVYLCMLELMPIYLLVNLLT